MSSGELKLPLDEGRIYDFSDLSALIDRLLSENGCPWDKAQTLKSLKEYLTEECNEAVQAVDSNDMVNLREELGDVLFQIFFMAKLCENSGKFDINAVTDGIVRKMISRHTHIFGADTALSADDVEQIWKRNKLKEKMSKPTDCTC